jgi:hypothetical protein
MDKSMIQAIGKTRVGSIPIFLRSASSGCLLQVLTNDLIYFEM